MARYDLEIIPPQRSELTQRDEALPTWAPASSPSMDGLFSSAVTRWRAGRRTRTLQALTATMDAARDLFDAETRAIESRIRSTESAYRLAELPQRAEREAARRRAEEIEELRELEHRHQLAAFRRATERAHAETTLLEAQHTAAVQRERGYELLAKQRSRDVLDVDLALAEREAVLRQHLAEMRQAMNRFGSTTGATGDAVDEALYQARSQLQANGLDTRGLDELLERRRTGR